MSIPPARRVSSSPATARSARNYSAGQSEQFVENIDTTNNILVRDDPNHEHHQPRQNYQQPEPEEISEFAPATGYINNTIEALAASGVFEEDTGPSNSSKVNVYGSNQSIIKDEELERTGRRYLKHFYEKNTPLEEVDELI